MSVVGVAAIAISVLAIGLNAIILCKVWLEDRRMGKWHQGWTDRESQ